MGAPGADGEGGWGWETVGWGQQRGWGSGKCGGSTVGVSSTSKNRPSHHKYKSPKQLGLKELKGSKST